MTEENRCPGCKRWVAGDEPAGTPEEEVCLPHTSPDCWNLIYEKDD